MDWSDLEQASGRVVGGHRLGERLEGRSLRTQRMIDRRSGRFWLLDTDAELAAELAEGITAPPVRGVMPVLASGVLDEGHGYLITTDRNGPTLDDLLEEGSLEPMRVVGLLRRLAMAYRALHEHGVVLLDLRPRDIFVDDTWDEGVLVPPHPALVGRPVGRTMGGYCAPDVALGDVDARADQFTLGVIGFELLTGTTPHNPDAPPDERTMLPVSPLEGVSPGLSEIIQRLLADDRSRRYPSMTEAQQALEAVAGLADEPTYGHYTPVMPQRRAQEPVYVEASDLDDESMQDSILSFLAVLLMAWAIAMGLSALIFWMW